MIRWLIILIFLLITTIGLAWLAVNKSYVIINLSQEVIQIELWLVVLGLALGGLGLYIAWRISRTIWQTPRQFKRFLNRCCSKHQSKLAEERQQTQQALTQAVQSGDIAQLLAAWQQMPNRLHQENAILHFYVAAAIKLGGHDSVFIIIERQLRHQWDNKLVTLYGLLPTIQIKQRLQQAEKWTKTHPDNACVWLTAGRIALNAQLWGKAEQYLQQSHTLKPSVACCLALATAFTQLDKTDAALTYYQQAAELQPRDEAEHALTVNLTQHE